MTEKRPPSENFDWVTARSHCSLGEVFEKLRQQVKADVEKREAMRTERSGIGSYFAFKFVQSGGDSFTAMAEGTKVDERVRFECDRNAITAKGKYGKPNLMATLTLSNDGECRVMIGGREYDLWQFRKMALEHLFFEFYER